MLRLLIPAVSAIALACDRPEPAGRVAASPVATAAPTVATGAPRVEGRAPEAGSPAVLLEAARRGDLALVAARLAAGADVRSRDANAQTPLHLSARGGHIEVARALIAAGAEVSARDDDGNTPYYIAALARHAELTGLLLDAGADRIGTKAYGGTPLIAVAERGWVDVASEILKRPNIPVDHVNNLGWTALIEAIVLGRGGEEHREMVRLLLAAGADPNRPDGMGRSPRTLAVERGYAEMVTMLEAAGGQ